MGRRSRKRAIVPRASARPGAPPEPPAPARRRSRRDEAPPAPWGSFPLVELGVLVAIVIGVLGFVTGGHTGIILLATGCALGSLAGLEISIREHIAGYRSHTTVLALVPAVVVVAALYFAMVPRVIFLPVGAAVFAAAFFALRDVFRRRSGGLSFR